MSEAIKHVKKGERWFVEPTAQTRTMYHDMMQRDGLVLLIETHPDDPNKQITYYAAKELCICVNGVWKKKVEVILDEFGEAEWLDTLRSELGIARSQGISGINAFMKDSASLAKYKEIRDKTALMAKEAIERRS